MNKGLVQDEITGPALIFDDISETDYDGYDKYRAAALSALGIISGKGDNKFDPYAAITRQEAAVLLNNLYWFLQNGGTVYTYEGSRDYRYTDDNNIAEWASYAVYNMRYINVMNGVGNNIFAPKSVFNHQQTIVSLMNMLKYLYPNEYLSLYITVTEPAPKPEPVFDVPPPMPEPAIPPAYVPISAPNPAIVPPLPKNENQMPAQPNTQANTNNSRTPRHEDLTYPSGVKAIVVLDNKPIRENPSEDARIISRVNKGDIFSIGIKRHIIISANGKDDDEVWFYKNEGTKGWIFAGTMGLGLSDGNVKIYDGSNSGSASQRPTGNSSNTGTSVNRTYSVLTISDTATSGYNPLIYHKVGPGPTFFYEEHSYTDSSGFCHVSCIKCGYKPKLSGNEEVIYIKTDINDFLDILQTGLDIAGLIPVIGEPIDGANAIIYLMRGDKLNAALSSISMIPIAGWASTGGKVTLKVVDNADDAAKIIARVGKTATKLDNIVNISRTHNKILSNVIGSSRSFDNVNDLNKFLGSAGSGRAWHHIVPQSSIGKNGITAKMVHNTDNIINIPKDSHEIINGIYAGGSIRHGLDSGRLRDLLGGGSFDEQFRNGIDILKMAEIFP